MARIIGTSNRENGLIFKDRFFVWIFLIYVFGILIGCFSVAISLNDAQSSVNSIWYENFTIETTQSVFSGIISSFFGFLLFFLPTYLLGVCAVGTPFLFVVPFIFSIGKGAYFSLLICNSKGLAILKNILLILPQNLLLSLLLLASVDLSLQMSLQSFSYISLRPFKLSNEIDFRKYNQRYILIFIILIFLSIMDALLKTLM